MEEPFSIIILTANPEKSITGVNGEFVLFQVLFECLLRLKSTEMDKKELISVFQNSHKGNLIELDDIREFEQNYAPDKVLCWYTKESFFYRKLNIALRTKDIQTIFLFRGFISDIHRQLKENQVKNSVQVYRAQKISSDEFKALKESIGQYISINAFFSTSTDEKKARAFLGDADTSSDLQRVLFEIHANPTMVTKKPFADISPFSDYDESEILFMLGSIFHLQSIDPDPIDDQIWIIRMSLCSDDEHDLQEVLVRVRKQTESGETDLRTLAKVLWKMGKYDLARKYLIRLLKELLPSDPLCGTVYEELGDLAAQTGDTDGYTEWYKKACACESENQSASILNRDQANDSIGKLIERKFFIFELILNMNMNIFVSRKKHLRILKKRKVIRRRD